MFTNFHVKLVLLFRVTCMVIGCVEETGPAPSLPRIDHDAKFVHGLSAAP
jgi:hypothetical protein